MKLINPSTPTNIRIVISAPSTLDATNRVEVTTPTNSPLSSTSSSSSTPTHLETSSHESTPHQAHHPFQPFSPHLPEETTLDQLDTYINSFLTSPTFEIICIQAVQLAALLPCSPPPTTFISFDATPMHHWYQAILVEFTETFMRHLRHQGVFPGCYILDPNDNNTLQLHDDIDAFNAEATAHINCILASFNSNFEGRWYGSMAGLSVDGSQPHAPAAAMALREATSLAGFPPKNGWRVGEPLHAEYKRRLRMFENGVTRLIAERGDVRWILGVPEKLGRGVGAYKEYYIGCLRREVLSARMVLDVVGSGGVVRGVELEDVFGR